MALHVLERDRVVIEKVHHRVRFANSGRSAQIETLAEPVADAPQPIADDAKLGFDFFQALFVTLQVISVGPHGLNRPRFLETRIRGIGAHGTLAAGTNRPVVRLGGRLPVRSAGGHHDTSPPAQL